MELLRGARALIARGWCQHAYRNGDKYCALGALNACCVIAGSHYAAIHEAPAAGAPYFDPDALIQLEMGLTGEKCTVSDLRIITTFNDSPTTTQADVLQLYDRAIAQLEREQDVARNNFVRRIVADAESAAARRIARVGETA